MSMPFDVTFIGRSLHLPALVTLAREYPYRYVERSCNPDHPGFQICFREGDHGCEIGGKVLLEPSTRDPRIHWITISGRVTLQEFCQKIQDRTEHIPDENVMVHCSLDGLMHFHYDHS